MVLHFSYFLLCTFNLRCHSDCQPWICTVPRDSFVLDPVNNESITQFFRIRYAAAPAGKAFPCSVSFKFIIDYSSTKNRIPEIRELQLPSYTPGVQLANKQPSMCFQAGVGLAPKTPFRNAVPNTNSTRRLETRSGLTELTGSEDCHFLKYIFELIDM